MDKVASNSLSAELLMIRIIRNFHQSLWNCHSGNFVINDRIAFRGSNRERNELWLIRVAVARVAPHLQRPNSISQRHVRSDRYLGHTLRTWPRQIRFHDTDVNCSYVSFRTVGSWFSRGRRHPRGQRRATESHGKTIRTLGVNFIVASAIYWRSFAR